MSLVNYSSDEEEEEEEEAEKEKQKQEEEEKEMNEALQQRTHTSDEEEEEAEERKQKQEEVNKDMNEVLQRRTHTASCSPSPSGNSSASMETVKPEARFYSSSINPGDTSLKLPDAAQLLASFDSGKESSAVNVTGSAFTSMKRSELNGSVNGPPKKIPKGRLMPSRILPDTAGGSLLPPQLRGRSNVATEDLDKLFSRRRSS